MCVCEIEEIKKTRVPGNIIPLRRIAEDDDMSDEYKGADARPSREGPGVQ